MAKTIAPKKNRRSCLLRELISLQASQQGQKKPLVVWPFFLKKSRFLGKIKIGQKINCIGLTVIGASMI